MNVKSRTIGTIIALTTALSFLVPMIATATDVSADSDDPSLSFSFSWKSLAINPNPFPLPLINERLFPLVKNVSVTIADTKETVKKTLCEQVQLASQCPLPNTSMTLMDQTPLSMDYIKKQEKIALENQKKEEKQKNDVRVQYEIASLPHADVEVGTSSDPASKVMYVPATAYSSTVDQTDSSPCTTANGYNVCQNNQENVLAANFLPFGTRVRIPDMYGDRVFTVQDRMAHRFSNRIDVWMKSREAALQFGYRKVKIEVLEN
ncbi:MAG: hypothetical protein Q8P11_02135 [bacterium]|nr:hypothetical protein [bacterium]